MASQPSSKRRLLAAIAVSAALATVGVAALLVSIFEHKQEAKSPFFQVVELNDTIDDPAVWGKNFPLQYDRYKKTTDMERTRYGGSEGVPHSPTEADPRTIVSRSKLELDPRLKTMWAGYAFAADYREKRGHAFMLEDQVYTERQRVAKQPGTCLNCHASLYSTYMRLGEGDLTKGFEAINHMSYADARKQVSHPIACVDCHEAKTMALRISRPAFIEGIRALKASQGVKDYDVNRDAGRQEMRSYVCAQCHVTYYFRGTEKRLTFPWPKGLKLDQIVAAENEDKVAEWNHKETGASMMKARHPEFETWSQGIHARSGVACADCHMPYVREGAMKISDHNVRSPLLNVNASCQTCHRWPEQELKSRVEEIQTRFVETRNVAMNALVDLIGDIKAAREAGATDDELAPARKLQRDGQFMIDFLVSENSMGFHADQYTIKSFAEAINLCREGQLALRRDVKARNVNFAPNPSGTPSVVQ
ncbi:ammonia-forming cytochrome c nitrite reductase subunit c552 [Telmatospirillum siberiense]|uniref:nitrite reductase (cytochrome; ammonia-forming) n=1 Tax=Telmatospirillum siberiense TaxID=382514 RepID=A0A2N3PWS4_9PROT|nr:ammonia-forming cytochrome c nitrite reductase subunit c552 [Telmatospirillum siberiense]PKU24857.1 ammonia-forming cytochrome c nitrite reductase subunit c552 [Telmatospirillum siberiense]